MYEEESIKEIKQLYQEERGFLLRQKKMHPMKELGKTAKNVFRKKIRIYFTEDM